jgi:hypothetical protein
MLGDEHVTLFSTTFAGNSAAVGGAILNAPWSRYPAYSTIRLYNTVVADSPSGGNCSGGDIVDNGHNLHWPGADCGGTIQSLAPLLDPAGLQDNGGPTQTIALLPDSPAIDAGDERVCGLPPVNGVDQRGYVRPGIGATNCSIGAYEFDSPGPAGQGCIGDCDDDGNVTVDELITLVNIALGDTDVSECEAGDADGSGTVTVDELVGAVGRALLGCPVLRTSTLTRTSTMSS